MAEQLTLEDSRLITGVKVYLTALRLKDGELLILASSKKGQQSVEYYSNHLQVVEFFNTPF
ncbi:MAG: hypothetical protein IPL59_05990 [Candidatus Competibacteraceae bacterium]|nr:hypothetical protein [Candidatus Competibacteraceae bacterium]